MTLTRDQLRAARMLLHLRQDELAELSGVAIASIKRFETGKGIRASTAASLRSTLEDAGALFFDGGKPPRAVTGPGVTLKPDDEVPAPTKMRIAREERSAAERVEGDRIRRKRNRSEPDPDRRPGRPGKGGKLKDGSGTAIKREVAGDGKPSPGGGGEA